MTTVRLRTSLLLLPLALPFFAACKTGLASAEGEHWAIDSVPPRMSQHFFGYRGDRDGRFVDYQYQKKKHINRTLRRHFANNDPDSPFQADDPSQTNRRPPHSIWPDPLYYMGAESLFTGVVLLGITGAFIPLPIDSLVATFSPGGFDEFGRGFSEGADSDAQTPPSVREFRVKNR